MFLHYLECSLSSQERRKHRDQQCVWYFPCKVKNEKCANWQCKKTSHNEKFTEVLFEIIPEINIWLSSATSGKIVCLNSCQGSPGLYWTVSLHSRGKFLFIAYYSHYKNYRFLFLVHLLTAASTLLLAPITHWHPTLV